MDTINILAVDDEPFNLDLIEAALEEQSHVNLTFAEDGFKAIELISEIKFDVVLLDISMPDMDGIEVLEKIRADEKNSKLPVLMVTANPEKKLEAFEKGASDFITKPYNIEELKLRTLNYAKISRYQLQINRHNEMLEKKVQERTQDLQKSLTLAKETEYEISIRLGRASEFRDLETGGHIKRMSYYSEHLARLYGLDDAECELVLYAAPLHDIGKVGIPDKILLKPGRFVGNEFEIMKKHSEIGAKMLEDSDAFPVLKAGRIIALEHHEKYDGTGYPNSIKGENIHLYARIVAIADVFDALSSKRVYKDAMPLEKTLSIMKESSGEHFDPVLLNLFLDNLDDFLEIRDKFPDDDNYHSILDLIEETKQ
ncbi:MAG: response regulator [Campylobacterota bacterium]|nr:response regulator [Campylobacterota bacterium]